MSPEAKNGAALHLQTTFKVSERRACHVISLPLATKRFVAKKDPINEVVARRLEEILPMPKSRFGNSDCLQI